MFIYGSLPSVQSDQMRNTEPDFLVYKGQRRLSNVVLPSNFLKLRLYLTINIRDGLLIPKILFICGPREQVQTLPLIFLKFQVNPYPSSNFLKLNLRFIYNEILSTMKAIDTIMGFRASLTLYIREHSKITSSKHKGGRVSEKMILDYLGGRRGIEKDDG